MQHVHYDLDKIEVSLRKMYAAAPAETLSDDPDVAECFRRSIDVMVASSRFVFTEIMAGTKPDVLIRALEALVTNVVVNHLDSFASQTGECKVCKFLSNVHDYAHAAQRERDAGRFSEHVLEVSPVTSGRA